MSTAPRTPEQVLQGWRDLRERLVQQLDMFETGVLTLRSDGADVAPSQIRLLRGQIDAFDTLIAGGEPEPGAADVGGRIGRPFA